MKPLTTVLMLDQLVRFNDLWPKFAIDEEQMGRMAVMYKEALEDVDADAVAGGASIYIRTATNGRWPSPAHLRECAMRWVAANRDFAPLTPRSDGCHICGATARWAILATTHYLTGDKGITTRMIQPCDADRHSERQPLVPYPPNFVRWATDDDFPHLRGQTTTNAIQALTESHAARQPAEVPAAPRPREAVPRYRGDVSAGRDP